MTKGKPAPQHELVVTALSRCLSVIYPGAELTQGKLISDLKLKPDIYVAHPDGRRWAYEVVHKNAGIAKIEANHQIYVEAGVQDYWILWETQGPDKPLDESGIAQSMWLTDEMIEGPKNYSLTDLQRTLALLGEGRLYVFVINKALQKTVKHIGLKLGVIAVLIYHFSVDDLREDLVSGDFDMAPLPALTFGEEGEPMPRPEALPIPTFLRSQAEIPSDRPVSLAGMFGELDQLLNSPETLAAMFQKSLGDLQAEYGDVVLPQTPEFTEAWSNYLEVQKQTEGQIDDEENIIKFAQGFERLSAALPEPFRSAFQAAMPIRSVTIRQMFDIQRWLEEDEHVQALLDKI